jgi:hypothetical protein
MGYNLNFTNNATSPVDLMLGINTVTSGKLAILLLTVISIILLVVFKSRELYENFIATGLISTLLAVFLWGIGLISFEVIFFPIVLTFVGLVWKGLN